MLVSQKRLLGIAIKSLSGKLQGEDNYGDQLKELIPVGPFEEKIAIFVHVRGSKGEDKGSVERYRGVSFAELLDYAIGFLPGFTEDNYRRLAAGCIEMKRAELENRPIRDVTYKGSQGEDCHITAEEIQATIIRAQERMAKMKADAGTELFSNLIKETVPQRGRIEVAYVGARARKAKQEELRGIEHLKQTKKDQKVHGVLYEKRKENDGE